MNADLSIIMPVLNEAASIAQALDRLAKLRQRGAQVIVVDGGSTDQTLALCAGRVDAIISAAMTENIQARPSIATSKRPHSQPQPAI